MSKRIIQTEKAPKAVGTYSQGVEVNGTFYFSGVLGLTPSTMEMEEGFDAQIKRIMSNIDGLLASQSLTRENIVKTTIFLKDLENFPGVNAAYEEFFTAPYPARSCIEAARLPKDAEVEIEVIAVK